MPTTSYASSGVRGNDLRAPRADALLTLRPGDRPDLTIQEVTR